MNGNENALGAYCSALKETTIGGVDWLTANEAALKLDLTGPIKELRKAVVEGRRLARAADRKMCVGVFGPSQAGKSYLISALARQGARPVTARMGDRNVDFLAEINPPGGKESTGLVTRFTVDEPANVPAQFPVALELLSETDIVKVLANAYVFDVNRDAESEENHSAEAVQATLNRLESRAGTGPSGRLDPTDIVDLEEYCARRLVKNPRIKVLARTDYWKTAARIAHRLAPADRAELFGVIWQDIEAFTNVYRRLYQVLERFDFCDTLYASFDALADRAKSIITVDALVGVGEGVGDSVEAQNRDGRRASVLRNELATITAELKIYMRDTPFDFFRHTDLLDFPGYRSRMGLNNLTDHIRHHGMSELLIRGKVAYLFERYSDDQELTSMLLCQGPENFEVQELVPVVYDWIRNTHGANPAERMGKPTSLFFIQTKYDKIFEESSGKGLDASRYVNRLAGNLTADGYGKQSLENGPKSWPHEWTKETPFQNIFLLRNPTIIQDNLFDYEEDASGKRETGVRGVKHEYIQQMRRIFIESATIRHHYGDPEGAWDAMMALNDGGVGRIAACLRPVSDPRTKSTQIKARAARLADEVQTRLQPYYYSGDIVEQKKKKRAAIGRLSTGLKRAYEQERFGELLRILQIEAQDLYALYEIVERRPIRESEEATQTTPTNDIDDGASFLDELLFDDAPPAAAAKPAAGSIGAGSINVGASELPRRFAAATVEAWIERMDALGEKPQILRYFNLSRQDWVALTQELQTAARRCGLFERVLHFVERGAAFRQIPKSALIWKQAKPAAQAINEFVAYLGFGGAAAPTGTQIQIDSRSFQIFPAKPPVGVEPPLSDKPLRYDQTYFRDWVLGLTRLTEDNVEFEAGTQINVEQNEKLGAVLSRLAAPAPQIA